MAKHEPTYRIDPIEPDQIGPRFRALLDRLEPVLVPSDVAAIRDSFDAGAFRQGFDRLDAATDALTVEVQTGLLVEIVLLGQAIRAD